MTLLELEGVTAFYGPVQVLDDVSLSVGEGQNDTVRYAIAGVSFAIIVVAVVVAKRRTVSMGDEVPAARATR